MEKKTIRITFLDVLIYLTLAFLCMQFFVNNDRVRFFVFFDSLGIKHIMIVTTIVVGFLSDLRQGRLRIKNFTYEIKFVLAGTISLILITFIYMAFNGMANYWISQVYFILAPLFFAYTIFKNDWSVKRFKHIINFILFIVSVYYVVFIIHRIVTGGRLGSFSFLDSTAPFENEVAHFYLFMYIFYTFNGNYMGRFVSGLFCIIAWKRLCVIYFVFITIVGFMKLRNKKIKIGYMIGIAVFFTALGVFMQYAVSDEFVRWFNGLTGMDFADLSNFRYFTIRRALSGDIVSKGLGSFFSVRVPWYGYIVEASIHNDLLRLLLEVSVVGLFLYLAFTAVIAKRRYSMFVVLYIFIEMAGTHMMGNGGIPFWFMVYTLVFYFNRYNRDGLGNIYLIDDADNEKRRLRRRVSIKDGKISIRK